MRLVWIEFVKDTDSRYVGERLRVDPMSADSFVNKKKVAKLVGDSAERAEARQELKTAQPEGDD